MFGRLWLPGSRYRLVVFLALLLAGNLIACNGSSERITPELDSESVEPLSTDDGVEFEADSSGTSGIDEHLTELPDATFSATSVLSGLDVFAGYHQEMKLTFEGINGEGQSENWWISAASLVDYVGDVRSVDVLTGGFEGGGEMPSSFKAWRGGGIGYLYMPATGCVSGQEIDIDSFGAFGPEMYVGEIVDARLVDQDVDVDGVLSYRYEFSEGASSVLSQLPFMAEGQILVSATGAYVKQLILRVDGQGDFLGDGRIRNGLYTLEIENWPLDESNDIEPPVECTDNLRYPVMEQALEITSLEEVVSYKAPANFGDIIEFYSSEMAAAGWSEVSEPQIFEDLAILVYQKDSVEVTIQISIEQGLDYATVFISP